MALRVTWIIDSEEDDPVEAARQVWRENFNRGEPGPEDACVFEVTDPQTGTTVTVDLSEHPEEGS